MKPENFDYGGGPGHSVLHPAVLVVMCLAIVLVLVLPRRRVLPPFLLTIFLVPMGQQIYFAGGHWLVLRILILVGCLRFAVNRKGEILKGGLNSIDKVFIIWALCRGIAPILLFQATGAAVYQVAFWIEAFGGYFVLRHLIQDEEDIVTAAKTFAVMAVVFSLFMLNEKIKHVNMFGYTGSLSTIPQVRDGTIRAQAAFGHPILAGAFGATLLPLFFWLCKSRRSMSAGIMGIVGSTLMVLTSASSTPLLAYVGGVGALFLWPIRRSMRLVRWGIVLTLLALSAVMKAPVWFILAHMNVIGASGGYDRAALIDVFLKHFGDWWLIGTNQTGSWGFDMWDLSNQFAAEGETGGLIVFVCFLIIISMSFSWLGTLRKQAGGNKKQEWLYWSLGAVMFAHILAYLGVSYWDQTIVWWFAYLAMISAIKFASQNTSAEIVPADSRPRLGLDTWYIGAREIPNLESKETATR